MFDNDFTQNVGLFFRSVVTRLFLFDKVLTVLFNIHFNVLITIMSSVCGYFSDLTRFDSFEAK